AWRPPTSAPPTSPSPRQRHALAYDSARDRIVLFGGEGPTSSTTSGVLGDTWEWNGSTWTQMPTSGSPSARQAPALAYGSARGRTVLFAGSDPNAPTLLADTWEWDGSSWSLRTPANSPPARASHRLCFDCARARTVLFGGLGASVRLADTWEWDGSNWVQ